MSKTANQLIEQLTVLKNDRMALNASIEELSKFLYPYEAHNSTMWDTTGSEACIKLSSLISSLITPQGQRWHGLSYPLSKQQDTYILDEKSIMSWCDDITDILFRYRDRPHSGFSQCLQSFYTSAVECGTGCFYVESDIDAQGKEDGIRYIPVPFKDVYIWVNHQQDIDTVLREFKFTAEQIVSKWGENVLSSSMKRSLEVKDCEKYTFIHAVYPKSIKERRDDGKNGYSFKNFHSKYVCVEEKRFFEEKQIATLGYVVGRFRTRADEIYGKSPALEALPAIRRLNEISSELAQYARLSLNPPFIAPADAKQFDFKFKIRHVNIGAVNKEGKALFHPIPLGNPHPYYKEIERIQSSIHSLFLLDLFQILEDRASRSAAESLEKTKEKGAFVAPIIGRIQSDFLSHMVAREIDILSFQGKLPTFEGSNNLSPSIHFLKVEATSPLFKYQQAEAVSSVYQSCNGLIELSAKTGQPEILDVYDFESAARFCVKNSGSPAVFLRDDEEVKQIRLQRYKQMEQMKEQEMHNQSQLIGTQEGAKVAGDVLREKQKAEIRESFND
ncbi:portal protein [Candidatus Liberibacter americanus]|uniref:Bacteriophage head to tail connecting protein n=1 Tax=Candidatus Liberibacter americanus str. Sao Paulo TaxID=1261131 RepID=U6B5I4_9HYPH|nr:portal protein [Candidatus Liberibacter americanus]AHA28018.1 hypothetical protein lam_672 [Candidatus Liberibacter americanus str. Sao Paulo]EMS35828.1 head-to-tail joining protein [Candidatus Liberibacter americanus PW_SP]